MDPFPKEGEGAAAGEPSRGAAPSSGVVVQVREKKGPLRAAIPYMPFPVAVICLFLNTFVPGLGKEPRSSGRSGRCGRTDGTGVGGGTAGGGTRCPHLPLLCWGSRTPPQRQLSPTAPREGMEGGKEGRKAGSSEPLRRGGKFCGGSGERWPPPPRGPRGSGPAGSRGAEGRPSPRGSAGALPRPTCFVEDGVTCCSRTAGRERRPGRLPVCPPPRGGAWLCDPARQRPVSGAEPPCAFPPVPSPQSGHGPALGTV